LDHEAIEEMTNRCLSMAAGGKINSKNAWDLPLIAYLPSLIHCVDEGGSKNAFAFAHAGGCVGASADVYGRRVDSLHDIIFHSLLTKSNVEASEDHTAGAPPRRAHGDTTTFLNVSALQRKKHTMCLVP
jgi:hypothetical protein